MKENGFYIMLALVSVIGLLALGLLIYKALNLPKYGLNRESVSTSSTYPQATEAPQPSKK